MKKFLLILILLTSSSVVFSSSTSLRVGDFYQGGVIFWLDPTKDFKHGLIVDIKDRPGLYSIFKRDPQTEGLPSRAGSGGPYEGKEHAKMILEKFGSNADAAYACATSDAGGFNDWYLPSANEAEVISLDGYSYIAENIITFTINYVAKKHGGQKFTTHPFNDPSDPYAYTSYRESSCYFTGEYEIPQYYFQKRYQVRCIRAF